jgi:branched-chain amino acid transport system ATP-binding protein
MGLCVRNLDVFYGDFQALSGDSLTVPQGTVVALAGANTSGKSTLLSCISGLVSGKRGTISFRGQRIDPLPPHQIVKAGIVLVPEGRRIFSFMSVLENIDMGAYLPEASSRKKENREMVFDLLPVLKERRKQTAGSLSGGEQQMLAIARGLMSEPKLLMLDEPSLGLAPLLVDQIFDLASRIRERGVTVLLADQNVRHALDIADYLYVLGNGSVVLEGRSESLRGDDALIKAYLGEWDQP